MNTTIKTNSVQIKNLGNVRYTESQTNHPNEQVVKVTLSDGTNMTLFVQFEDSFMRAWLKVKNYFSDSESVLVWLS